MTLEIKNLTVKYGDTLACDGVSIAVDACKTMGIVGESGSGKSALAKSILKLTCGDISGKVIYDGKDLLCAGEDELTDIRGKEISIVFQEPMTALNPVMRVGAQLDEVLVAHGCYEKKLRRARIDEVLREVELPPTVLKRYPHELSGGMRQRVLIAMAVMMRPKVLICDEITTALDVIVQRKIIDLIKKIKTSSGTSVLFITHNLKVLRGFADEIAVMYGGEIVERGGDVLTKPAHPYTLGLIKCADMVDRLPPQEQNANTLKTGCKFAPRCFRRAERCKCEHPDLINVGECEVRCFYPIKNERDI